MRSHVRPDRGNEMMHRVTATPPLPRRIPPHRTKARELSPRAPDLLGALQNFKDIADNKINRTGRVLIYPVIGTFQLINNGVAIGQDLPDVFSKFRKIGGSPH